MHISEGMLDLPTCTGGYAAAAVLVGIGLYRIEQKEIPKLAVMGASFFVASLIHFKIGPSSIHLTLGSLMALILGYRSILAIVTGLFFQAVMFQHGGLSTLGVNAVIIGLPAMVVSVLYSGLARRIGMKRKALSLTAAFTGFITIFLSALLVYAVISLTTKEMTGVAAVFSISHIFLALVEGIAVFFIIFQILKVKPGMLYAYRFLTTEHTEEKRKERGYGDR